MHGGGRWCIVRELFGQDYHRFDPRSIYYIVKNMTSHVMKESEYQTRFNNKNKPLARITYRLKFYKNWMSFRFPIGFFSEVLVKKVCCVIIGQVKNYQEFFWFDHISVQKLEFHFLFLVLVLKLVCENKMES